MIKRLYIHNFRCLENFDLPISGQPSSLLIGKNGAGKSTVGDALQVLQQIARGTNRVRELVSEKVLSQLVPPTNCLTPPVFWRYIDGNTGEPTDDATDSGRTVCGKRSLYRACCAAVCAESVLGGRR